MNALVAILHVIQTLKQFPKLLKLQEKPSVESGYSYCSNKSCNILINQKGKDLGKKLHEKMLSVEFFSALADSSKNLSAGNKKAAFVQHLSQDTIWIVTSFLNFAHLKHGYAAEILATGKKVLRALTLMIKQ